MKLRPEDFTQFRKSSPWGYLPSDVEKKIDEYDKTVNSLIEENQNKKRIILELQSRISRLEEELREMHLQMSSLELPSAEAAIEHTVLSEFKNYNSHRNKENYMVSNDDEDDFLDYEKSNMDANKNNDNKSDDNDDTFVIIK